MEHQEACAFCEVVAGRREAHVVFEDGTSLAFLDHRPLFAGHVLVVPRGHDETLADLPQPMLEPFFFTVQLLSRAMERAVSAQGTFVAMNNRVSQSVPHLHVHVVPRSKGDGLKGFFWPRQSYSSPEHLASVRETIRQVMATLHQT
jgi:histidine triad (HIT) family protein